MCRRSFSIFVLLLLFVSCALAKEVAFVVGSYKSSSLVWVLSQKRDWASFVCIVDERTPDKDFRQCVKDSKVLVLDIMMNVLAEKVATLKKEHFIKGRVYCVNSSKDDERYKSLGFIFDDILRKYYANPVLKNYENMFLYALHLAGEKVHFDKPVVLPKMGIYHPKASRIFTSFSEYKRWYGGRFKPKYWVGILFYQAYLDPLHKGFLDAVISRFEKEGWGVVALYSYPAYKGVKFFLDEHVPLEVLVSYAFKMSASVRKETKEYLERLNVPVISAINLFSETIREWRESDIGLSSFEISWQMNMPELSGLIEPVVLSGRKSRKDKAYSVIHQQLEFLVGRIRAWIRLRHKPNSEKRIVIVYYNHSPGKQNIGASYLNVFKSLEVILKRLKEKGYIVRGSISEDQIKRLLVLSGRNVGSWAPGELKSLIASGNVVLLPIDTYKRWYSELPASFRRAVDRQWGKPEESGVMTVEGKFVLPVVRLGNVVLAPQPQRGVSGNAWKLYHSHEVYPHHQYIAFYLWLTHVFHADAVIHLGTHGTLEWLPGKQAGLDEDDPPQVLIQDLVDIYPYVVDDVGEGIQAKRRGWAVVIDHLTPPIEKSGLYKEYAKLYRLIGEFETASSKDVRREKLKDVERLAKKMKLLEELHIEKLDEHSLGRLEHYLLRLKEDLIPYGLHTFGVSPDRTHAKRMAQAMGDERFLKRILASGPNEMKSLFKALSGGYVPPASGNDPVVNPSAVPTGYNFYAFDPARIPSPQAWRLAKGLVDKMLSDYLKKHKKLPKKVSVVLWATETIRNEGINEAQILWLIGMKPVWDKDGRVVGIEPISAKRLGRPRIDVVVHASGLYRDMFPDKLKMLDEAIRRAALLRDTENFISENARLIEEALVREGVSKEQAKKLSLARVFSEKVGDYGTGVSLMTANTGFWNSSEQVASVFLSRTSFAYGKDVWGKSLRRVYEHNLAEVDVAVHSISSNLYRALDNDDVFQYLGGVAIAVKALSGHFPEVKVARSNGKIAWDEDVSETLSVEMRTRYFNPKWIKGMMREGYAGAREMEKFVEYLWGWQVTTPFAVKDYQWLEAYNVYVKDKYRLGLREFFARNNPWAYQSLVAWMLEAIRKGYWKASNKVKITLAREYVRDVVRNGVACCEHTCNNPFLNQFVVQIVSLPGVMSPQLVREFVKKVEKATGQSLKQAVKGRERLLSKIAVGVRKIVKGFELVEQRRKQERAPSSGVPWAILAFALLLSLTIVCGVRRTVR